MAHLEVEPKPGRPWWVWVLIVILFIVLGISIFKKYNAHNGYTTAKQTTTSNLSFLAIA